MITSTPRIFGFTGLMASGKGAAASYFQTRYGATTFRFSTILRDILKRLSITENRESLARLSEVVRQAFGDDILAQAMAHDAATTTAPLVIVEGIRRIADLTYLRKLPNFVLVAIEADAHVRYERLIKRGENAGEQSKTWEEFQKDQALSTELTIAEVLNLADEHINNNGTPQELETKLDDILKKYPFASS